MENYSILGIEGVTVSELPRLKTESYVFSGDLTGYILSSAQLFEYRKELETIPAAIEKFGWVAGAQISIVRSTISKLEEETRVKWKLINPSEDRLLRYYRSLGSLMFPVNAKILKQKITSTG